MTPDYKDRLYASYLADHLTPRKGGASAEGLRDKALRWERTLRGFLPTDRGAAIADLGCGYGSLVWWLQQIGYTNAAGLDVSRDQIEHGERLGVRNLHHGDVLEFLQGATGFLQAGNGFILPGRRLFLLLLRLLFRVQHRPCLLHFVDSGFQLLDCHGRNALHVPPD